MIIPDLKHLVILVIEDSLVAAKKLIKLLNQLEITKIKSVNSYRQAVKAFDEMAFDVIIADIFLGQGKKRGDDFIRYTQKRNFVGPVIYLTGFYEKKIYDEVKDTLPRCFLSKELSLLSLRQALELSFTHNSEFTISPPHQVNVSRLFVKHGTSYKALSLEEVLYFDTRHKVTFAQLKNGYYSINISLKDLEEQLSGIQFVRVHRGYLINLNYMESINLKHSQITIHGNIIPIGQFYRKQLLDNIKML